VLQYKSIEYDIEYIDLAAPPAWFLNMSPLKKVPLLIAEGHVIFESTVINEYIDEAYPNKLHPANLILRAQNRSWIELGNRCTRDAFLLSVKETQEDFMAVLDGLLKKFDRLEMAIAGMPFFNGNAFSLVDATYAPLFQRLDYLNEIRPGIWNEVRHPRITAWKENLLGLDAVRQSTVPEIKALYHELLRKRQGYISRFLGQTKSGETVAKSLY
jgi:glutathione S-transferase